MHVKVRRRLTFTSPREPESRRREFRKFRKFRNKRHTSNIPKSRGCCDESTQIDAISRVGHAEIASSPRDFYAGFLRSPLVESRAKYLRKPVQLDYYAPVFGDGGCNDHRVARLRASRAREMHKAPACKSPNWSDHKRTMVFRVRSSRAVNLPHASLVA